MATMNRRKYHQFVKTYSSKQWNPTTVTMGLYLTGKGILCKLLRNAAMCFVRENKWKILLFIQNLSSCIICVITTHSSVSPFPLTDLLFTALAAHVLMLMENIYELLDLCYAPMKYIYSPCP